MAKIKDPRRFSDEFKIDKSIFAEEGIFNPILNVDTKLFVDPFLLKTSKTELIAVTAYQKYQDYFKSIIKLLSKSQKKDDVAWKAAKRLLTIEEAQGTSLGYGAGSTTGRKVARKIVDNITHTAKEIVDIGIDDPELFSLLPLMQDGIGADLLSDYVTSIIESELIEFTLNFATKYSLPVQTYNHKKLGAIQCLLNPIYKIPILLLPSDILSKLPTASDWSSVRDAADFNSSLRRRVNLFIANVWAKEAEGRKEKFRNALLRDKSRFEDFINLIKGLKPEHYNLVRDEDGLLIWHEWLEKANTDYPLQIPQPQKSIKGIQNVVEQIINQFQFIVEERGLNKLLWKNGKPAPEKVSQLLFFAIAYSYCKANNVDISPETDVGTGLIDFKFSEGFNQRVILEVKLSSNPNIVSGYEKQLEIYKGSEETKVGYYLVMNVGSVGKKFERLNKIESEELSKIIFINGILKPSASKQK